MTPMVPLVPGHCQTQEEQSVPGKLDNLTYPSYSPLGEKGEGGGSDEHREGQVGGGLEMNIRRGGRGVCLEYHRGRLVNLLQKGLE